MVARLDVMFRVGPSTNTLTARYDPGGGGDTGDVSITLTSGLYTLAGLMAEIETQLQANVDGSYVVEEVPSFDPGYVQISAGTTNNVTWDHPGLRDWLGFTGDLSGSDEHAASNQASGVFVASAPWATADPLGWEWHIKGQRGPHQRGNSLKVGRLDVWRTRAFVHRYELAQFRKVMGLMLRGLPARWFRDADTATAWSFSNWWGYVDVMLAPTMKSYADQWIRDELPLHLTAPLEFLRYSG